MRRVLGLALTTLVALHVLALPAVASELPTDGSGGAEAGQLVLAADGGDPVGPEPMDRQDENNPARELANFEDPEVNFTYGAAYILAFTGLVGVVVLVGLYWLLVHRPRQRESSSSS